MTLEPDTRIVHGHERRFTGGARRSAVVVAALLLLLLATWGLRSTRWGRRAAIMLRARATGLYEAPQTVPGTAVPAQLAHLRTCRRVAARDDCELLSMPPVAALPPFTGDAANVYRDPTFHTLVKRLPLPAGEDTGWGVVPVYSPLQAWNADGSLLFLQAGNGFLHLYDGNSYRYVRKLGRDVFCYDGSDPNPHWDNIDADTIWYTCDTALKVYSVRRDQSRTVHEFAENSPFDGIALAHKKIKMRDYCNYSDDNRRGAFTILDGQGIVYGIFTYDIPSNTVLGVRNVAAQSGDMPILRSPQVKVPLANCISPSGKYVYVQWALRPDQSPEHWGTEFFDVDYRNMRRAADAPYDTHSDSGWLADGSEVFVNQAHQSQHADYNTIFATRFRDMSVVKAVLPESFHGNGWHVSMRARDAKGWLLMSTYHESGATGDTHLHTLADEIFAVKLDGSGEVRRIAHHHSVRREYWDEPHAAPNRDLTKIIFGSNWAGTAARNTKDTYVVELRP